MRLAEISDAAATPWSRVPPAARSRELRYYHRRAQRNRALGLTVTGKERRRRPNARTAADRKRLAQDRSRRSASKRILFNKLNGLTTRGKERVIAVRRGDAFILREQLDNLAAALSLCFGDLPPSVQARVIELEKHLSAVRRCTS